MSDKSDGEIQLRHAWRSLSHRLAVAGGSFVALLSLFHHVPVSVAAMRGAAGYFALLIVSKLGLAALSWALQLDSRARAREEESNS